MKILVLSANTGQGHNSAGKAIVEAAAESHIEAQLKDTFLFHSPHASRLLENIHTKSARYAPRLIGVGNRLAYKMTKPGKPSIVYTMNGSYADALYRFIIQNDYDIVIATHIFAAEALTFLRREYPISFRCYFVVTDYAFTPFVPETDLDGYFLPHRALLPLYERMAPGKRYMITGIPVGRDIKCKTEKPMARQKLGFSQQENIIMLTTGSMGFGNIEKVIEALSKALPENTRLLVFCGTNQKMRETLSNRYAHKAWLEVYGYTENLSLYYDACDVLMAKPGGLSSTEAAVHEIPFVQMKPMPGWEEDNVAFFQKMGLSAHAATPEALAAEAISLLKDNKKATAMQACQKREIPKAAAAAIIQKICEF